MNGFEGRTRPGTCKAQPTRLERLFTQRSVHSRNPRRRFLLFHFHTAHAYWEPFDFELPPVGDGRGNLWRQSIDASLSPVLPTGLSCSRLDFGENDSFRLLEAHHIAQKAAHNPRRLSRCRAGVPEYSLRKWIFKPADLHDSQIAVGSIRQGQPRGQGVAPVRELVDAFAPGCRGNAHTHRPGPSVLNVPFSGRGQCARSPPLGRPPHAPNDSITNKFMAT